jgi:hypothetical protein
MSSSIRSALPYPFAGTRAACRPTLARRAALALATAALATLALAARARLSLAPPRLAPRRGGGGALGVGRRFAPW